MKNGFLLVLSLLLGTVLITYGQETPQQTPTSAPPQASSTQTPGQPPPVESSPAPAVTPPTKPNSDKTGSVPESTEPATTPPLAPPIATGVVASNNAKEPPAEFKGRLLFINFPSERVFYLEDGAFKSDSLPHVAISSRGEGGAAAAGFAFGILGAAALPAIYKGRQNSLFPDEAIGGITFFPDGQSLLFSYPKGGDKSRKIGLDGKKLNKYKFGGADPDISKDGQTVLLAVGEIKKGKARIAQYNLESGKQTALVIPGDGPQFCPRLSPDEKEIVYLDGPHGAAKIVLFTIQGGTVTTLQENSAKPVNLAWSPEGKAVYYASMADKQIHRITIETKEDITVTSGPGAKLFPVPTRDGKSLIFCHAEAEGKEGSYGGQFHLEWMDLATGKVSAIELKDPPKYFSAISPTFWQP